MLIHDSFSSVGVTLAIVRELVVGRRFRYVGRARSLAVYRADLDGAGDRGASQRRPPAGPAAVVRRNVAMKVLLTLAPRRRRRAAHRPATRVAVLMTWLASRPVEHVLVVTPTYQEADNIERFLAAVRAAVPGGDDPGRRRRQPRRHRRSRRARRRGGRGAPPSHKAGLGSAYRDALGRAVDRPFDAVVHLDADLSHDPARIPVHARRAVDAGADVVIGSRYVPGGNTVNWPLHRRLLSRWGNRYTARCSACRCTTSPRASAPTGSTR